MKYDTEWLKFKIAVWLDNHYDDACWANLVLWATGVHSFRETFGKYGDWRDQSCSEESDGCYCGKCCGLGRLKE